MVNFKHPLLVGGGLVVLVWLVSLTFSSGSKMVSLQPGRMLKRNMAIASNVTHHEHSNPTVQLCRVVGALCGIQSATVLNPDRGDITKQTGVDVLVTQKKLRKQLKRLTADLHLPDELRSVLNQ